jgi:hypothetical protein
VSLGPERLSQRLAEGRIGIDQENVRHRRSGRIRDALERERKTSRERRTSRAEEAVIMVPIPDPAPGSLSAKEVPLRAVPRKRGGGYRFCHSKFYS